MGLMIQPWRTGICTSDENGIWVHGYDIASLMEKATFADMLFLLHRGRLPNAAERRLLDAILIAVADHGPGTPSCASARLVASGNRQSLSAAIAAGVLAIGDEHDGAGAHTAPITFMGKNGKQYVVVTATGGGFLNDRSSADTIIAFALP